MRNLPHDFRRGYFPGNFDVLVHDEVAGQVFDLQQLQSNPRLIQKLKSGNYFKRSEMADGSIAVEIDYLTWAEQTVIWCVIVIIVGAV